VLAPRGGVTHLPAVRARHAVLLACVASAELLGPRRSDAQEAPVAGVLAGRVLDANERPVPDARVVIEGLTAAITDSTGRFAFGGLESETFLVRIERLGYALTRRTIVFSADTGQYLLIRLGMRSTVLARVTVLDSAEDDPRGYARRRQHGQGFYLTQSEIRQRGPTPRVENILGTIPGLKVDFGIVKVARGRVSILGNNCEEGVQYWVDGAMTGPAFSPRSIAPETLTGIEVYRTASSTPLEYRSMRTICGTVVLWTY
jgi:hypothetical protein